MYSEVSMLTGGMAEQLPVVFTKFMYRDGVTFLEGTGMGLHNA